jgi:hypothetical protein
MTFIFGIAVGFFIRHVLWFKDKRDALMNLFKNNKDGH